MAFELLLRKVLSGLQAREIDWGKQQDFDGSGMFESQHSDTIFSSLLQVQGRGARRISGKTKEAAVINQGWWTLNTRQPQDNIHLYD